MRGQRRAELAARSIKRGLLAGEAEPDCRGRGRTQEERQGQSQFPEPRSRGRSRRIEGIERRMGIGEESWVPGILRRGGAVE